MIHPISSRQKLGRIYALIVVIILCISQAPFAFGTEEYTSSESDSEEVNMEFFVMEVPNSVGEGFEPHILVGPGIDGEEWIYIDSPTGLGSSLSGNLWISTDGGYTWEFKETGRPPTNYGGSGDSYTAVFSDGTIVYTDLYGFTVTADTSFDGGDTWVQNPLASVPWLDDRQWFEIGPSVGAGSGETLYLTYNSFGPNRGFYIQKSQFTRAGLGWIPGNGGRAITTQTGSRDYFIVDRNDGTLYLPNTEGANLVVYVSDDGANTFTQLPVVETLDDIQNIFVACDVDNAGNLYLTWTDKYDVFLAVSEDRAQSWDITQVTKTEGSRVLPWVVGGDMGRIGLTWYESEDVGDSDIMDEMENANWSVKSAICIDALSQNRTFLISTILEDVHTGTIKTTGASDQPADRDLGDFFTNDYDSLGRMVVTFGQDGDDGANSYQSAVMYAKQMEAPFLLENTGPVANFTLEKEGLTVYVDASESYDLNGNGIAEYKWDFGDGTNETGETAQHTYAEKGEYEITLKVVNMDNQTNRTSMTVSVGGGKGDFPATFMFLIVIILLIVAVVAYYLIKKKGKTVEVVPLQ
jgi:hypothetical protein